MRVILKEDYPSLGFIGDSVSVKSGYARNFLFPKEIAIEVGSSKARQLAHIISGINARKAKKKAEAEAFREHLEAIILEFTLRLGEQGKSFGAVTVRDIELELQKNGITLDRKQIRLQEPIKSGGSFPIQVKLHSEVTATLNVKVQVETPLAEAKETEEGEKADRREKKGKRGRRGKTAEVAATAEPKEPKAEKKGKKKLDKSEDAEGLEASTE